MHYVDGQSL
jgi:hypothetical protein